MKFLINLASVVLCICVLALGAYLTYQQSDIGGMVDEIVAISEKTPIFPDNSDDNGGDVNSSDDSEEELGGSEEKPSEPDQGGSTDPENPEQGGDVDSSDPENPEQGGDVDSSDPENPEQGGDVDSSDPNVPSQPESGALSTDDARDAFGSLYDNSDPTYNDLNREFFTGMVSGFFGSNSDGSDSDPAEPDPDEPDFDDSFDGDFGDEFNPDEFNPDDEDDESEEEVSDTAVENIIVNVAGTYYDNLQAGIQANQQENAGASAEEQQAARDEFIEREAEAFAGLINVVTNPEDTTDDQLVQSVDALINSDVCLGTVTQSTENNPEFVETVQEATQNINEETKTEIENKINEALASNPEKEQEYQNLANLFGITLGSDVVLPDGLN